MVWGLGFRVSWERLPSVMNRTRVGKGMVLALGRV